MKIAVEGCLHGELDKVYATIQHIEQVENTKIDLLLCCGDFQAVRNENDLESLSCPPKYRSMNSFWKYYSGQAVAPVPTIFIGGNHEASNYLWELYYGGWAAPNIYFLGYSGVIKFGNIRIGGLSGIYKSGHYHLGHFERPPYTDRDLRSVYHIREYDVMKLKQIKDPIDVFMSHDWPVGIYEYGNSKRLVQHKPFFKEEIEKRTLGSMPAAELLSQLKPQYWFSAHLHCKFSAVVKHKEDDSITKFLALDKCLPGRSFLQIIDINSNSGPHEIHYDDEWLAITRKFNSVFPLSRKSIRFRSEQYDKQIYCEWVRNKLNARGARPFDFVQTVAPFHPSQPFNNRSTTGHCRNPQTESLLEFLELPYLLDTAVETNTPTQNKNTVDSRDSWNQYQDDGKSAGDENIIELDEVEDEDEDDEDV
ncbi:lariat debranching enzyme-like [Zingiber officinale]|uniref:lariat debranching enzyme-like n=1 Tax=Zingiber officinale TaxID=94328 RepID=UPI001C4B5C31|nr:lariat debranching enzyme-like [Zingiber officinale]